MDASPFECFAKSKLVQFVMGFEKTYLWVDPIRTGVVFGAGLAALISTRYFSLISVFAYLSLAILAAVIGIKVYTYVMVTFLKKDVVSPIAKLADMDLAISSEHVTDVASRSTDKINCAIKELRRLFLVENVLDSIKFGTALWVLTYIGSLLNATTLVILAWIVLFTGPKIYELKKDQIDRYLDQAKTHFNDLTGKVTALMPQAKAPEVVTKKED